jgi:hypothetical protein
MVSPPSWSLRLLAAALTVVAGVAGWVLAGPPSDATAITPPGCPASYRPEPFDGGATADRPGATDRLVPVGPVSVGPVSVRVCGYAAVSGVPGARPAGSLVLDPTRTAELAALLDPRTDPQNAPKVVVRLADPQQQAACRPGASPALLVFRYKVGRPLTVAVDDGTCALAATASRAELGRADVVRRVGELLTR